MTSPKITSNLPDSLAAARDKLAAARDRLAANPLPPMTAEEIQAEIEAYRAEQKNIGAGRPDA